VASSSRRWSAFETKIQGAATVVVAAIEAIHETPLLEDGHEEAEEGLRASFAAPTQNGILGYGSL